MIFLVLLSNALSLLSALIWIIFYFYLSPVGPLDWEFFCAHGLHGFLYPTIVITGMLFSAVLWQRQHRLGAALIPLFPPACMFLVLVLTFHHSWAQAAFPEIKNLAEQNT